jgi:hypothetical protein
VNYVWIGTRGMVLFPGVRIERKLGFGTIVHQGCVNIVCRGIPTKKKINKTPKEF